MSNLTNDDLFEIEKVLDFYSGLITGNLSKLCQTAINFGAVYNDKSPLNDSVNAMKKAYDRIREISKKLELKRKEDYK